MSADEAAFVEQGFSVFKISDYEWFAAPTKQEAIDSALKEWGYDPTDATSMKRADDDGCFERDDVYRCNLDENHVTTTEPGEKPEVRVTYRALLKEMIELKQPLPAFFCGQE